jgi:hypothetical protein
LPGHWQQKKKKKKKKEKRRKNRINRGLSAQPNNRVTKSAGQWGEGGGGRGRRNNRINPVESYRRHHLLPSNFDDSRMRWVREAWIKKLRSSESRMLL